MQVNFWTHACAEIVCSKKRIVTDPWLVGPAFLGGWWLKHKPPADWLMRLQTADAIYISHSHSDHMNHATLDRLASVKLDAPIYVPDYESKSAEKAIARHGFTNVKAVPLFQWVDLGDGVRFQILPDTSGRDDSGLVVDDNGKILVNTVDAPNLNAGKLPCDIEWLLAPFSSGASCYPLCFPEQYDESHIRTQLGKLRDVALKSLIRLVNITQPANLMPFAGYFNHHPRDAAIEALNGKNTAEQIRNSFRWTHPHIKVHLPESDLETSWDDAGKPKPIFVDLQDYFDWAGYRGDFTLCIEEMDPPLRSCLSRHFVDFLTGKVTKTEPHTHGQILKMQVRRAEFHQALAYGLGWEELAIGFHCRFWRCPDYYEAEFWDHFQNRLPKEALCPMSL